MKNLKKMLILILIMTLFIPFRVCAVTLGDGAFFRSNVNVLVEVPQEAIEGGASGANSDNVVDEEDICDGSDNSLLGNVNNPTSVAWLVNKVFNYLKVLGPALVVILSSMDFIGVIIKSDDDAMAKARTKLIQRIVLAVLLFVLPTVIMVLSNIFGITSSSVCGIG